MSQITSYSWDEENRMVGVLNPDGSSESFTYSGDGQRRSKSTYTASSTLSNLIDYVWDGENVLQEVDGTTGDTKAHYTDYPGYWGGLTSLRTEATTPACRVPAPSSAPACWLLLAATASAMNRRRTWRSTAALRRS